MLNDDINQQTKELLKGDELVTFMDISSSFLDENKVFVEVNYARPIAS